VSLEAIAHVGQPLCPWLAPVLVESDDILHFAVNSTVNEDSVKAYSESPSVAVVFLAS
jgi:hypothetical protein